MATSPIGTGVSESSERLDRGRFLARHRRQKKQSLHKGIGWLLLPALALYTFVVLVPSARGAVLSFTDWDGLSRNWEFVGFAQFERLLSDTVAVRSIRNTVFLAFAYTAVQTLLGLVFALGVTARIRSKNVLRVLIFSPVVVTPVASAYLWQFIYTPRGVLNASLELVGLGSLKLDWLGDPDIVLWSILVVIVWQYAGLAMVIFVAGLETISSELLDAAAIDGATAWNRFWYVQRPLLAPAFTINVVLSLIGGLKLFDQILVMTNGGPGHASETMSTLIYKNAFVFGEFAYAIAMGLVLAVLVAGLSGAQYRILNRSSRT